MGRRRHQRKTTTQQPVAELSAQLCTHFAKGRCRFGDTCWFAHSCSDERQDADAGSPTKLEDIITVAELVSEVTPEVKRLKEELHASEQARAELKQEVAAKGEELRRESERADAVEGECDELKQQLERLSAASRASIAQLQQEASGKAEELRCASERVDAVRGERDELKQQVEGLRLASKASEHAIARLYQEASGKAEELRRTAKRVDRVRAERNELAQKVDGLRVTSKASERTISQLQQEAAGKGEELRRASEWVDAVRVERDKLKQHLEKLSVASGTSELAIACLQQEVAGKAEELRRVSERADAIQDERDKLKQQLERLSVASETSERTSAWFRQEALGKALELHRASERADAVQAERDKLKQQVERLSVASEASEHAMAQLQQEAAVKSEELRRASERANAVQAERDKLKQQLKKASARPAGASSGQPSGQAISCVAEWCFESRPGEWTSLPASSSADLLRSYQDFSKGGSAIVHLRSGVEEYTFDFKAMSQTNKRTGKSRAIKCQVHAPSNWSRCATLESICKESDAESFELSGFGCSHFNGTYVLSSFHRVGGYKTWWHVLGHVVMYVQTRTSNLLLLTVTEAYADSRVAIGKGNSKCHARCRGVSSPHSAKSGWEEWYGDTFQESKTAHVASPGRNGVSPLMEIAVEFTNKEMVEYFSKLFRSSTVHQTQHHGVSGCTSFKDTVKVVRVLRIENFHLWAKYQIHLEQVRRELSKLGLTLAAIEPGLLAALQFRGLDEKAGEHMLFHGTDYETAVKIALEGFDFRLGKPGFYGQGTYFASQACKSHQYTTKFCGLRTIIVSRVVVGDVAYAAKVDKGCKRPPPRAGMPRCCDTVVAKPGPMPGHHAGEQTHQEFVIFDKYQAYPEYIVQYTCDDA